VDGEAVAGEEPRDAMVGDPAAVVETGKGDPQAGGGRVAHSIYRAVEAGAASRAQQERAQLLRALAVPPVADPDQVGFGLDRWQGVEDAGVGGLMPGPGAGGPAAFEVDAADHLAVGEDAVVVGEVEALHLLRRRGGAVVGVVEEQAVPAVAGAVGADPLDQLGLVPLVDEDEVGVVEGGIEVEAPRVVGGALEVGEGAGEVVERRLALLAEEVFAAPAIGRLVDRHLVPALLQLGDDPAEEVGVAVVPVGDQRVGEVGDLHAATLARRRW